MDIDTNLIYRKNDGLWYHADETWAHEYGPFKTRVKARKSLERYAYYLDHGFTTWQWIWYRFKTMIISAKTR